MVEKLSCHYLKVLRSDKGKEYKVSEFEKFCEDERVDRQLTSSYTPQHNSISAKKNQTVMQMAMSILKEKVYKISCWLKHFI